MIYYDINKKVFISLDNQLFAAGLSGLVFIDENDDKLSDYNSLPFSKRDEFIIKYNDNKKERQRIYESAINESLMDSIVAFIDTNKDLGIIAAFGTANNCMSFMKSIIEALTGNRFSNIYGFQMIDQMKESWKWLVSLEDVNSPINLTLQDYIRLFCNNVRQEKFIHINAKAFGKLCDSIGGLTNE